ncbi:uncharacterized protein (DUF1501 family) [Actinoplanes campanulatus]|uniref:Uncharacterized protein (DUF1501 family) n=1 Tax=Actinoplanes campanulatus TaxID=113559 RepID=A0A7W5ACE5_9ACTN|nr:DUF1501 domain-containing protein [Actinoplanes campanulatus]MBB3093395.1 uncharacterized protein (DUF1501 family) [Actinoplanes campanulatus]GGN03318.1 hypothetical protein GCM10010109_09550 [Actinoplanes campanulatus]GID33511.1 hypothetical protein Aca09nite_00170 [Actinoplanes campanulatus]
MTTSVCGCEDNRQAVLSRRRLLAGGAAVAAGVAGATVDTGYAFAADPAYAGDVLVLISLRGGFDGLSAVVPAGDPAYYAARPTIGVPKAQLIGGDAFFGLNPGLAPLLPYWTGKQLAAVHAVGQPAPNRSHFSAMEELERAAPGTSLRTGWLNRMLGTVGSGDPFQAVAMGTAMPARVLGGPAPYVGVTAIDRMALTGEQADRPIAATMTKLFEGAPTSLRGTVGQLTGGLQQVAKLRAKAYTPANGAVYPGSDLGNALRDVARLVKTNSGLRSATVDSGDWDMHENLGVAAPGKRMYDQLKAFATALAAFAADLGPEHLRRVTVITISEFGRRVAQNGSGGLDHGYGNAMFVLGGNVKGGKVYGRWPGLTAAQLRDGDLAVTTDYRAVIGEILRSRCGVGDLNGVFPGVTAAGLGIVTAR